MEKAVERAKNVDGSKEGLSPAELYADELSGAEKFLQGGDEIDERAPPAIEPPMTSISLRRAARSNSSRRGRVFAPGADFLAPYSGSSHRRRRRQRSCVPRHVLI